MCSCTPMKSLEVHVKVVLVMRRFLGDQGLLPMLPVQDILLVLHGPILLLVPVPSIVPAIKTSISNECTHRTIEWIYSNYVSGIILVQYCVGHVQRWWTWLQPSELAVHPDRVVHLNHVEEK
jgi:hypothetical protein